MIVCCVHCYAVTLIIAFVDVNKTYLILSYLIIAISARQSLQFPSHSWHIFINRFCQTLSISARVRRTSLAESLGTCTQWRHQDLGPGGHSPSLPFPSLHSPFLPSPPLEVGPLIQLGGLGERCKLPQWGLGRCPSRQTIWCISGPKGTALVATVLWIFIEVNLIFWCIYS